MTTLSVHLIEIKYGEKSYIFTSMACKLLYSMMIKIS